MGKKFNMNSAMFMEKYSDEEREKMSRVVKRILGYRDEEWDAVLDPELMTKELFMECMADSARIGDFETFSKLSAVFPDYCEELFDEMEAECAGAASVSSEIMSSDIMSEEIQAGLEKLKKKLGEKNKTDVL